MDSRLDKLEDEVSNMLLELRLFQNKIDNTIAKQSSEQVIEQAIEPVIDLTPEEKLAIKKQIQKEKNTKYYEKNRERLLEKARNRVKTDSTKQLEYNKRYLEKNKERLNKLRNEKFNCVCCGGVYTYTNYTRHLGTEKHISSLNSIDITKISN